MPSRDRSPESNAMTAALWAKEHPSEWLFLVDVAHGCKLKGRPLMRDQVYTMAANERLSLSSSEEFKRDHNVWAALVRYLVMLDPSLLSVVNLRRSALDGVDMAKAWDEVFGDDDFVVRSAADAREAYANGLER